MFPARGPVQDPVGCTELTVKVDLLHYVLGFDALLLVADEDLPRLRFCPAVFAHPDLQLVLCRERGREAKQTDFQLCLAVPSCPSPPARIRQKDC